MSIKLVAFDLDGTLIDSAPDIARAVDVALVEIGLEPQGPKQVIEWVGDGLTKLMKRALTGSPDGEPQPELLQRSIAAFRRAYGTAVHVESRLYPDADRVLKSLHGGYRLVCITNKPAQFTEPLLTSIGIRGYFDLVVSGDSLATMKPDPKPLLHVAENLGVLPEEGCMVGDSKNDVLAAKAAGFRCVAVSHGYHQGADLVGLGAETLLDSLAALPAWLASAGATG